MSLFGSSRREGMVAVLLLLLLCVLMHAPGLFLDQSRMLTSHQSKDLQHREVSTNQNLIVPALQAAGRVVSDGEVPLWNPYSRFGESFLSTGAPLLYPPFWLLMVDGGWRLLDLVLCLHTFIACMCMYRFLRNLPLSRYVSFVGGGMYGLGWCMTVQLDRLPQAAAAALLPLALAMTWRLLVSHKRELYALLQATTMSLLFTTGGTGTALLGVLLCVVLFGFGFLALDSQDRRHALRAAAGAAAIAALLTSPLWLYWLTHASAYAPAVDGGYRHLQASGLLGVLSPTAFGGITGAAPEALRAVNPGADPMELVLYPGACVLFLVVLGVLRPKRTAHGLLWILVGGVGLFMTLDSPVADFVGSLSPWQPPSPGLGLVLVNIAAVCMGAVALENFFEAPAKRTVMVPITAGIFLTLAAFVGLAGYAVSGVGMWLVESLSGNHIASEVQPAASHLFDALLQPMLYCSLIATAFLFWRRMGILRFKVVLAVLALSDVLLVSFLHTPRTQFPDQSSLLSACVPEQAGRVITAGRFPTIPTGQLVAAGLPTITTTSTTLLDRTRRFLSEVDASMVQVGSRAAVVPLLGAQLLKDPLLELAVVGVGICTTTVDVPGFAPIVATPLAGAANADDNVHVYRRHQIPPRVRILFQATTATNIDAAVEALNAHANQLGETVVIEDADPNFVCKRPGGRPQVEILAYRTNDVRIKVDMGLGRGYLLLADAYAPGWHAYLDGVSTKIYPADVAMRAVAVTEGVHEVRFLYSPLWWWLGLPLAGLGVLLGMAWNFMRLPEPKTRPSPKRSGSKARSRSRPAPKATPPPAPKAVPPPAPKAVPPPKPKAAPPPAPKVAPPPPPKAVPPPAPRVAPPPPPDAVDSEVPLGVPAPTPKATPPPAPKADPPPTPTADPAPAPPDATPPKADPLAWMSDTPPKKPPGDTPPDDDPPQLFTLEDLPD